MSLLFGPNTMMVKVISDRENDIFILLTNFCKDQEMKDKNNKGHKDNFMTTA